MATQLIKENGIVWLHATKPSPRDFEAIQRVFRFHPLIMEEIASPTRQPTIEDYRDHFLLILHFPIIYPSSEMNTIAEVDFLVSKKSLVTVVYQDMPRLEDFFKQYRTSFPEDARDPGLLLYRVIEYLLRGVIPDLEQVADEIDRIEGAIFDRQDWELVEEISNLRRDIVDLRRTMLPQQTALDLLPHVASRLFGKDVEPYFVDILKITRKIFGVLDSYKETTDVLHETIQSLLSNRISSIVSVLTIFSAIILPINFLASIWGMNHQFLPLRDGPYDFWVVMGIMAAIVGGLLWIFRRKRWL
ncbi:MAG: magnesium transporter CorA family protein [bacterium]|nr:magnesium transporter CorA family protein [bacterium]